MPSGGPSTCKGREGRVRVGIRAGWQKADLAWPVLRILLCGGGQGGLSLVRACCCGNEYGVVRGDRSGGGAHTFIMSPPLHADGCAPQGDKGSGDAPGAHQHRGASLLFVRKSTGPLQSPVSAQKQQHRERRRRLVQDSDTCMPLARWFRVVLAGYKRRFRRASPTKLVHKLKDRIHLESKGTGKASAREVAWGGGRTRERVEQAVG